jgi:WbqC-like protein family
MSAQGPRAYREHHACRMPPQPNSRHTSSFPTSCLPDSGRPLISARLSANIYVNPVGGRELFDRAEFTGQGVALQFLDFKPFIYDTPGYKFEENLSILDVLMWNSPDAIVQAIRVPSMLT